MTNQESSTPSANGTDKNVKPRLDKAADTVHAKIDQMSEAARPAVDKLSEGAHKAVDKVSSTASQAATTVSAKFDQACDTHSKLMTESREKIRAKPLAAVGIAVAAGVLLRQLFRSRK